MSMRKTTPTLTLAVLMLAVLVTVPALADTDNTAKAGKIELQSVGALEFGPDGTLFVGDSEGASVYAIEVAPEKKGSGAFEPIQDLDEKIAAVLGVGAREVLIRDMAVHPATGTVFLSVMRGRGDDAAPVIVQVDREGTVSELVLDDVRFSKLSIGNAPGPDQKSGRRRARTYTVTDLELIDGELFIAGLSNEEFSSTLRRAPFPFEGDTMTTTNLEIYHGAHGKFETHAPIYSFVQMEINGEDHLLAGYLCTPLVTFPLDEVKKGGKLRGKTIAELGWGNVPTDIVAFQQGDEQNVLIVNSRRGTMKVRGSEISAAQKRDGITTEAGPRTGVDDETVPLGAVAQAADFDSDHIAILARSLDNGSLTLMTRPKRRI